jgi:hypothetical protein
MNQMKSDIDSIIKNREALLSHGWVKGRKACLDIIEYALKAVDPYHATHMAVQLHEEALIVDGREYDLKTYLYYRCWKGYVQAGTGHG